MQKEFWDLVNVRYGWLLSQTQRTCSCGNNFVIEHALTCKKGGFITLHDNRLRNIPCQPTKESVSRCSIEPTL